MEHRAIEQMLDWMRNHYFGKYRGTVTDNDDSTNRGRVKVRVPAVLGDLEAWAMPCLPYAGKNVGVYMIPESGAGVWVEFEAGDPSYPVWTGGFWADKELPHDEEDSEAKTSLRIIRSEKGLMISLNDDAEIITISDSNGNNIVTIDSQNNKIRIHANEKAVVDAPNIELVEDSTHPVIFGDDLLQYLEQLVGLIQGHVHAGETALGILPVSPAPPSIMFPTPTNALLSQKVKTG